MCLRLENSGRLTCNPGEYFTSIMGHRVDCNHVINTNFAGSFRFFVSVRQDVKGNSGLQEIVFLVVILLKTI